MGKRVAESVVRRRPFGRAQRVRVELHGVSIIGPGDRREVMRWEWVESVAAEDGAVVLAGDGKRLLLPAGAFGLTAEALAGHLRRAGDSDERTEVISVLGSSAP